MSLSQACGTTRGHRREQDARNCTGNRAAGRGVRGNVRGGAGVGHARRQGADTAGLARLRDRTHRARRTRQRGRALLDARDQALQGQGQGAATRHPGLHRGPSDPELSVGRLHGQGRHAISVPDRPVARHRQEREAGRCRGRHPRHHRRSNGRPSAEQPGRHPPRCVLQSRRDRLPGLCPGVRQPRAQRRQPALRGDGVALARSLRGAGPLHRPRRRRHGAACRPLRVPLSAGGQCVHQGHRGRRRREDRV